MNDDQLIQKLRQLKRCEPKETAISALKLRVFSHIETKDAVRVEQTRVGSSRFVARFTFRTALLYPVAAVLVVVVVAAQGDWLRNTFQSGYVEARIALSSNEYDKARLALALAQSELDNVAHESQSSAQHVAYLSDASSQTNQYMTGLQLVGEPGQYSARQCLQAYKAYEEYLEELKTVVQSTLGTTTDPAVRSNVSYLLDKVDQYQQAASARLKLY